MRTTRRRALTLLDLLAALAVLAILAGLFLPAVQLVRAAAARTTSLNNLKQIALAVHNYESTYAVMPPGNDAANFSAFAKLLPYVEQEALFRIVDFTAPMDAKANDRARASRIKVFLSPRDPVLTVREDAGATNYLFCAGSNPDLNNNNGPFFQNSKQGLARIPDGSSNTILIGERDSIKNIGAVWVRSSVTSASFEGRPGRGVNIPNPNPSSTGDCTRLGWNSQHTGGTQFAFADGSVQYISQSIDADQAVDHCAYPAATGNFTLQNLTHPADGNPVKGGFY